MSQALSMFNSVGPAAFSNLACQMAPYFSTISPEISELKPGHAVVNVPFRKEITNHLASVHAIALCSGLMKPDTHLGENARHIEVSDDQATSCLFC